ncbi:ABC-three component system protein [Crenothrix polyspora]|uniref:SMEK domain-containing protein n=1 Tax=Crenothrix polyspora TaxID=360316 RepID=A0A1R4HE95_9GAMM|nr:ABC-three component system protein [Crenothrix polyspora]SJM94351.1 conserved hypothetical protein [Crenothrix polyspora]
MNRSPYFNYIEEKLSTLATRIELRGGLNILDLNIHAESFYTHFFNLLFGWKLINLNAKQHNVAGADLIDSENKIIVQVSATATKQKIESAFNKKNISNYPDYSFKFIFIAKNAGDLRTKTFANPYNLTFDPAADIFDVSALLQSILVMEIEQQKLIYDFLKKELKSEADPEKVETNLATIIKILSKEKWSPDVLSFETLAFDPEEKISYNQLGTAARLLIEDHKIYYYRIEKIYSDYDKQGANKSISILNGIRKEYINLVDTVSANQCFLAVIEKVKERIHTSANYTPIADEELDLCVQILVVDAFIRCKIFKNPSGDSNANS